MIFKENMHMVGINRYLYDFNTHFYAGFADDSAQEVCRHGIHAAILASIPIISDRSNFSHRSVYR